MIKLPARQDGNWTVQYSNEKMPDIVATRNLTFDKEGYLRLSKPTMSFYSSADDADFGVPIGYVQTSPPDGIYWCLTDKYQFTLDTSNGGSESGYLTVAQDALANTPNSDANEKYADYCEFNKDIHYTSNADLFYKDNRSILAGDWTDTDLGGTIGTNNLHPICAFTSTSGLAVGYDNAVAIVNTSYTVDITLTLPSLFWVTGIAYNNGYIGITTYDISNSGNGHFFVWDGKTTSANYSYKVGTTSCVSPTNYRGSFAFINGAGTVMYWTPQECTPLVQLPSWYNGSTLFIRDREISRNHSMVSEGDLLYFNIDSTYTSETVDGDIYTPNQHGGVWCFDPTIGLYHRHAPTATKVSVQEIATASVDIADNEITVTTAFPTGTPVRYSDAEGTAIAGLVDGQLYYTIYVDATTVKLASSYDNATAGTAVDLTGTGNANQTLQFYPKPDFGQSYLDDQQGVLWIDEAPRRTVGGTYIQGLFYGSKCAQKTVTQVDAGGFVAIDTENRGYFVTTKLMSQELQDDWQKIYLKHSKLETGLDKIVVKYRTTDNKPIVKVTRKSGTITWTDSDTFTTTDTQFANVLAGDEVEVVQGAGAGYLLHVSSITESSGTYTVNLDEAVKNISASDTGRVVVSRWTKLTTLNATTPQNNDGYSELPLGVRSKSIQFKIELRGEDVEIEEILIAQKTSKFAV